MARYRKIDPRIWNDEKFASLSHEGQRMFLFVLTHPSMTSLGAFRISREGMAAELGLDEKGFAEPFGELLRKGLVMYDERVFLVFAPNFLKYNAPENPNVVKGWGTALDFLPECPLLVDVLIRAKLCASTTTGLSKAFDNTLGSVTETLSKRYGKPLAKGMPKQEQEQEQELNNTNKQLPNIEAVEAANGEDVCFDSSVSVSDLADDLANEETQKVIDDSEAVVNPVQVIGLARMHGIKVYRSDRLNAICSRNVLTVDNIRQCIRIAKKENKGGNYLVGILSNAVNEPDEYHTWEYLDQTHKAEEAAIDWDKPFE